MTPVCPSCGAETAEEGAPCSECAEEQRTGFAPADQVDDEALRAFIGPNAEVYLAKFQRFRAGGVDNFVVTWHWPAFLATFWWFLYRKLYLWFAVYLAVLILTPIGLLAWIGFTLTANYIYYKDAKKKIQTIRAVRPDVAPIDLAAAGGVNGWVPVVAVLLSLGFIVLLLMVGLAAMMAVFGWWISGGGEVSL